MPLAADDEEGDVGFGDEEIGRAAELGQRLHVHAVPQSPRCRLERSRSSGFLSPPLLATMSDACGGRGEARRRQK